MPLHYRHKNGFLALMQLVLFQNQVDMAAHLLNVSLFGQTAKQW